MDKLEQVYAADVSPHRASLAFVPFVEQDNNTCEDSAVELNIRSLENTLRLPFRLFVAFTLLDQDFHVFLDSFLQSRQREWETSPNNPSSSSLERLDQLVFSSLHRLLLSAEQTKESSDRTDPSKALENLFSTARVMDAVALYEARYPKQLGEWLAELLDRLPKLSDGIGAALKVAHEQVWPQILDILSSNEDPCREEMLDKVAYARDIACASHCLYNVLTPRHAGRVVEAAFLVKVETIVANLQFYDKLCVALMSLVLESEKEWFNASVQIRRGMLATVHVLMGALFWAPLGLGFEGEGEKLPVVETVHSPVQLLEELLTSLEGYVQGESSCVALADYAFLHDLRARFSLLFEQPAFVEMADRVQYLLDVVETLDSSEWQDPTHSHGRVQLTNPEDTKAKSRKVKGSDPKQAAINTVKEVLPDLGHYFVELLLDALGGDPQVAIQRYLEGNVPLSLQGVDQSMEKPNVVQLKRGPATAADLLDQMAREDIEDDPDLKLIREKIKQAALAYDEYEDEYDDAYDEAGFDVGDDALAQDIAPNDTKNAKRLKQRDQQQQQQAIRQEKEDEDQGEEQDEQQASEDVEDSDSDQQQLFVGNKAWRPGMRDVDGVKRDINGKIIVEDEDDLLKPNLNHLRAGPTQGGEDRRKGAKRGSNRGGRGRGGGRGASSQPTGDPNSDSKEDPNASRGRRRYKQANKAKIANHSRKRGAAKKQAKGMFG